MKRSTPKPVWRRSSSSLASYPAALISVVLAVVLVRLMEFHWHLGHVESLLYFAIIFSAWFGGFRPCLVAIVLSVLAFYYFASQDNASALSWDELASLIIFALLALLVGLLVAAQRSAADLRKTRDELVGKVEKLKRTNTLIQEEVIERKRVEIELRRSEAFLAQAQRVTKTSSLWWKVATGEIFWSEESYRLMEYDRPLCLRLNSL